MDLPQPSTRALRRKLRLFGLPKHTIDESLDAYLASASDLRSLVLDTYHAMDSDDERHELAQHYTRHLDTLAEKVLEAVQDWRDATSPVPGACTQTLPREHRPLLDEYFKLNAYPPVADKTALAEYEGITYRQVHIWFQNRRARTKTQSAALPKDAIAVNVHKLARHIDDTHVIDEDEDVGWRTSSERVRIVQRGRRTHSGKHDIPSELRDPLRTSMGGMWKQPLLPESHQAAQLEVADAQPSRWRLTTDRRRQKKAIASVEDVITCLGSMNVRDASYDGLRERHGYAARQAITYFPPSAPLPSYVEAGQNDLASPPSERAIASLPRRRLARLPKRNPRDRRRCSMSSDSESLSERSSSLASRAPSLTFSDYSSSSSTASSPEPPCSPKLPATVLGPNAHIQHHANAVDVSVLSGCNTHKIPAVCDIYGEAGDAWNHIRRPDGRIFNASQLPSNAGSICSPSSFRHHPPSESLTPHAGSESCNSQSSFPTSTFSFAFDTSPQLVPSIDEQRGNDIDAATALTELFGPDSTAMIRDGIIVLPDFDELTLPALEVDPATYAGELDISLGTWADYMPQRPSGQISITSCGFFGKSPQYERESSQHTQCLDTDCSSSPALNNMSLSIEPSGADVYSPRMTDADNMSASHDPLATSTTSSIHDPSPVGLVATCVPSAFTSSPSPSEHMWTAATDTSTQSEEVISAGRDGIEAVFDFGVQTGTSSFAFVSQDTPLA